jgi:hypothetical protein
MDRRKPTGLGSNPDIRKKLSLHVAIITDVTSSPVTQTVEQSVYVLHVVQTEYRYGC